jgi:D-aminopeptidase
MKGSIAIVLAAIAQSAGVAAQELWTTSPAGPPTAGGPNILHIYDMEGLSGQDDIYGISPSDPGYPATRKLLTDDVNAVISGLFDGGAKTVTVLDGHGGGDGSLDIDVLADDLKHMPWIEYVTVKKSSGFDAVKLIPVQEVHVKLHDGAARALSRIAQARVTTVVAPVQAAVRTYPPAGCRLARRHAGSPLSRWPGFLHGRELR